jgi:hypothetical protein
MSPEKKKKLRTYEMAKNTARAAKMTMAGGPLGLDALVAGIGVTCLGFDDISIGSKMPRVGVE